MLGRIDPDVLPVDADGLERMILSGEQPPLIAVARHRAAGLLVDMRHVERRRRERILHPLLAHDALSPKLAVMHRHQAEARIIAKRGVEASERAGLRLLLALVHERVALRAELLPHPLLRILTERHTGRLLENFRQNLRVDALVVKSGAGLALAADPDADLVERSPPLIRSNSRRWMSA